MLEENKLNIETTPVVPFGVELRLDYQKLASQIIFLLRGDLTQRALSEMMGFSFNQVGKWESGATHIKWNDFFRLCEAVQIPIERHLRYSFWTLDSDFSPLIALRAIDTNINYASLTEKEAHPTLKKWLNGTQVPDFSDVLKIMGKKTAVLFGWLSLFINCEKIAVLQGPYEEFLKNMDSVLNDPLVVYMNAALQLEDYKKLEFNDDNFLAEHCACTKEEAQHALKTLLQYGLIHFDGKKYEPSSFDFSFAGIRHYKLRGLTKHTTMLASRRYSLTQMFNDPTKVRNLSQSSVRVVALSKEASMKVGELISKFHSDVGQIVQQDKNPKDNVQVMLIHSFASNINSKIDSQLPS